MDKKETVKKFIEAAKQVDEVDWDQVQEKIRAELSNPKTK